MAEIIKNWVFFFSFAFPLRGWGGTNTIISCCQLQYSMCQCMQWVALFMWTFASLPTKTKTHFAQKDHFRGRASMLRFSRGKYPGNFSRKQFCFLPIPEFGFISSNIIHCHRRVNVSQSETDPIVMVIRLSKGKQSFSRRNANFWCRTLQSVCEWCWQASE